MNIKEMRAQSGLSQSKFAALFNIPVRTLQAWEQEQSTPPEYVTSMMSRILAFTQTKENFNPFYDSTFMVSHEDNPEERRYLVEMCPDELIELRSEINVILERRGTNER